MQKINWYPGHMKKTQDLIESYIRQVDVVVELVDARIPKSSKNPLIEKIINKYQKKHLLVFTKSDLVSKRYQEKWLEEYEDFNTLYIDIFENRSIQQIVLKADSLMEETYATWKRKGLKKRAIRIMIVGVPNVGKSTLINKFAKKNSAKTGNTPGLTRSIQWIKVNKDMELLDMPGILWPKIDNINIGYNLAVCNSIKNEILDLEDIAKYLIKWLKMTKNSTFLEEISGSEEKDFTSIVQYLCTKYNFIVNDDFDEERLFIRILRNFNELKYGKLCLDEFELDSW